MPTIDFMCGPIILVAYLVFGIVGILLEYALRKHVEGIPHPVTEEAIGSELGRRLFRLDRVWRRSRTPVWLGLPLLGWLLCR